MKEELGYIMTPERHPEESFEDYKARRWAANKTLKQMREGRLFWNPYPNGMTIELEGKVLPRKGLTYRKPA